ncbi:MAG: substrate-binding domain-containing protein [Pseudomonadota bacterium]
MIRLFIAIAFLCAATMARAETVRVAVTTSFHNSGLADVLLPEIKKDTGLTVHLLVVGTGQALRLGRAGDVDAVLVHSRKAEEEFVSNGYGTYRREIMFNDFVLVGPVDDPAGIAASKTAQQALTAIKKTGSPFVSRGDDSGTHRREQTLWPSPPSSPWYRMAGAGMGATLNVASGLNAYTLSDRASWLNFANKGDLKILFSGDPALFNQYAFLPVSPQRHAHVNHEGTLRLEAWLADKKGQGLIGAYQIEGQTLFVPNAK